MSVLNTVLFGKVKASEPPSAVAIRFSRLMMQRELTAIGWIVVGMYGGVTIYFLEMILAFGTISPMPGNSVFEWAIELVKTRSPVSVFGTLLAILAFPWVFPRLMRIMFDQSIRRTTRRQVSRRRRTRRREIKILLGVTAFYALLMALAFAIVPWRPATIMSAMMCAKFGGGMIAMALAGRRGSRVVCSKCEYPMVTWQGSEERCPECGGYWKKPWGATVGFRAVRWPLMSIGIGGLVACSIMMGVFAVIGFRGL